MGQNKNKILVAVILVLFVASGMVLYNGFSGSGASTTGVQDIAAGQKEIVNLLPYGDKLDFTRVKSYTATARPFTMEPLDPANVGLAPANMFAPGGDGGAAPASGQSQTPDNPIPRRSQSSN
jgi:hypothetical protein